MTGWDVVTTTHAHARAHNRNTHPTPDARLYFCTKLGLGGISGETNAIIDVGKHNHGDGIMLATTGIDCRQKCFWIPSKPRGCRQRPVWCPVPTRRVESMPKCRPSTSQRRLFCGQHSPSAPPVCGLPYAESSPGRSLCSTTDKQSVRSDQRALCIGSSTFQLLKGRKPPNHGPPVFGPCPLTCASTSTTVVLGRHSIHSHFANRLLGLPRITSLPALRHTRIFAGGVFAAPFLPQTGSPCSFFGYSSELRDLGKPYENRFSVSPFSSEEQTRNRLRLRERTALLVYMLVPPGAVTTHPVRAMASVKGVAIWLRRSRNLVGGEYRYKMISRQGMPFFRIPVQNEPSRSHAWLKLAMLF
ncbi:hypothetical protein GQ607_005398 [Colletotrichum asianum]|uniref:Uncharacterized protein n=1 Tax=Colletotrichum asianum TaxID=702518 RepID=A0A8H3WHI1_9PEZI|nr:hypothetical protein GQ607_005398 [Colletotrichum asianum]